MRPPRQTCPALGMLQHLDLINNPPLQHICIRLYYLNPIRASQNTSTLHNIKRLVQRSSCQQKKIVNHPPAPSSLKTALYEIAHDGNTSLLRKRCFEIWRRGKLLRDTTVLPSPTNYDKWNCAHGHSYFPANYASLQNRNTTELTSYKIRKITRLQ